MGYVNVMLVQKPPRQDNRVFVKLQQHGGANSKAIGKIG